MSSMRDTIPFHRYNPNQVAQPIYPRPHSSRVEASDDLVSYLISHLPENVNPYHVLLGIGIAFAGVTGGILVVQYLRKDATTEVNEPVVNLDSSSLVEFEEEQQFKTENGHPPRGVRILHQCPRGRKTPCIAPYPLKLETFLRVAGIQYDVDDGSDDPNDNLPEKTSSIIVVDVDRLADTQISMKSLSEQFGVDLSEDLTPVEKAVEKAFNHLLEQKIYWGISLYRWVYDGARSIEKIQYLPEIARESIPSVARTVEHAAWHQGMGKRNPTEVVEDVTRDLAAISVQLGSKKFLLSDDRATELDCTAFSMLAQMLWTMDGPFHTAVSETYTNLAEFCWRMRALYWPDWEDCLCLLPAESK